MEKLFNKFSLCFSLIAGHIIYILGGLDKILICLVSFIVLDYISGIMQAIYNKNLNSSIGYKGIVKKVSLLLVVSMATMLENTFGLPAIREIVISFFIANEGISIVENLGKMDVPLPGKLKEILQQLSLKGDDKK